MSIGTFWIDEVPAPIEKIALEHGEVVFYADLEGISVRQGENMIRITDPEGATVTLGRVLIPTKTLGERCILRQSVRLLGAKPGEEWPEILDE